MNIDINESYPNYFNSVLTTAGVLLGLAFAAMTYILENGFSSFKFNRLMFLTLFTEFGKLLLYTLSYLVIISFISLNFDLSQLNTVLFYLFTLIFIKSILDYYKHKGYIHTLFSSKFVPANYGKLRSYFRYITNLGLLNFLVILIQLFIFIAYPVLISADENSPFLLSKKSIAVSSGLFLLYSVFMIARFIPQFVSITKMEYQNINPTENTDTDSPTFNIDYKKEKLSLNSYFESKGIGIGIDKKTEFLGGTIAVLPTNDDSPEDWFNISIEKPNSDVFAIRNEVDNFAFILFKVFSDSNSDVNSFVLSFHVYLEKYKDRNIFFRARKSELADIHSKTSKIFLSSLQNKLYDELFRDL